MFENKILRKIFGAKRNEIQENGESYVCNAELHALYTLANIVRNLKSRQLRWAGHLACMEQSTNAYRMLVGKLEGKRPLRRDEMQMGE